MRHDILLVAFVLCVLVTKSVVAIPWATFIQQFENVCEGDANSPCVIPANVEVELAKDINVRSLVVYGQLTVRPLPTNKELRITTAFFIATGKSARVNITAPESDTKVIVNLIRNKNAYEKDLPNIDQKSLFTGGRVFGGANGARIFVEGAKVKPIFTLLAQNVWSGCGEWTCQPNPQKAKIYVTDDVSSWPAKSTLVVSPSDNQYGLDESNLDIRPGAFEAIIENVQPAGNGTWVITVDRPVPFFKSGNYNRQEFPMYTGDVSRRIQSEVFILDRNIIFTGEGFLSRFAPLPRPPWRKPGSTGNDDTNGWPTPWSPFANSDAKIEGIHTIMSGDNCTQWEPCHNGGGWIKMRYARVEKAGQRGWIGRYPMHVHRMGHCPMCELKGNVVYDTQQRGIVVHSTGEALVEDNIVYNMRGAGIYIEEGTEIGNTVKNNVVVCGVGLKSYSVFDEDTKKWKIATPVKNGGVDVGGGSCQESSRFDFGDPKVRLGGCRITGTDNEQADCVQQAGIWALSTSNNFLGNRISNMYNGIYFQSQMFPRGRDGTDSFGKVCTFNSKWGIVKGNVCHSNERFGFYPDVNYPRNVERSIQTDGYVSDMPDYDQCLGDLTRDNGWCSCRPNLPDGSDNGQPMTTIEDQLDWGNAFVGQYDLADVQYLRYHSVHNTIGLYWKGSKMMNTKYDGILRAHVKDSIFEHERTDYLRIKQHYPIAPWEPSTSTFFLNVPGISGTILLENVVFRGDSNGAAWIANPLLHGAGGALGINQQCKGFMSGVMEGMLCTPQVLLRNVDFSQLKDGGNNGATVIQPQDQRPTFIRFGAESGNPYLGMVLAYDNSLCFNKTVPCDIRAVLPKYSTHLLNLPGNPCVATMKPYYRNASNPADGMMLPLNETGDLSRRYDNGILCKVQTRRLTIWGHAQGTSWRDPVNLVLIPPGKTADQGFQMEWFAFNLANIPGQGPCGKGSTDPTCCAGTACPVAEARRFAEGYGAAVIPLQHFPATEPWKIVRADGKPVNISLITLVEFSDVVFNGKDPKFPGPDTIRIQMNGIECTLRSTDERKFMTPYGPTKRIASGGSCLKEWFGAAPTPSPPTAFPTTRYPTTKPTKSPTQFPTKSPRTSVPTKSPRGPPTVFPTKSPTHVPTKLPKTSVPTKSPRGPPTNFPTISPTQFPTKSPRTSTPTKSPKTPKPTKQPTNLPTKRPTQQPTAQPTKRSTLQPTKRPTKQPTMQPTKRPTLQPTKRPTKKSS